MVICRMVLSKRNMEWSKRQSLYASQNPHISDQILTKIVYITALLIARANRSKSSTFLSGISFSCPFEKGVMANMELLAGGAGGDSIRGRFSD